MKKILFILIFLLVSVITSYAQFSVGDYTRFPNNKLSGKYYKPCLAFARNSSGEDIIVLHVTQSEDYARFNEESRILVKLENDSTYKLPIIMEYEVEKDYSSEYNRFVGIIKHYSTYSCYSVTEDFVNLIVNEGMLIKKIRIVFTNGDIADYDIDKGYKEKFIKGLQKSYKNMELKQQKRKENINDEDF